MALTQRELQSLGAHFEATNGSEKSKKEFGEKYELRTRKKIERAAEGLSQSLELLSELGFPRPKGISESFFEIWAANELIKYRFKPSVRKSEDYDILLSNDLKIEIKGPRRIIIRIYHGGL